MKWSHRLKIKIKIKLQLSSSFAYFLAVSLSQARCVLPSETLAYLQNKYFFKVSKNHCLEYYMQASYWLVYSCLWTEYGELCVKHLKWNGLQKQ